jgi:hypothetical protein
MIVHIIGPNMAYVLQTRDNYDPSMSLKFAKEVSVGRLTTPMTKAQLASLIYQTPSITQAANSTAKPGWETFSKGLRRLDI